MARVRRSNDLGSIEARRRLKIRSEPYFLVIEKGLALGYRKSSAGGTWIVRRYDAATQRNTETRIATADDHREADGVEVLSFAQAQRAVLSNAKFRAEQASGKHYTVADAVRDYIEYLRAHRKSADDAAIKLNAYVAPILGGKRVSELTPVDFDDWLMAALKRQQRRKPKKPRPEPKRRRKAKATSAETKAAAAEIDGAGRAKPTDPDEQRRRRKSTLNRVITALKAALNHAYDRQKVATRDSWTKLKKFKGVDAARLRWLSEAEAKRLMNAAAPDMRKLMQGGLMTGCRPGELARARARDFDSTSETLLVPDSKSGKPRRVPLTAEGVALLDSWTVLADRFKAGDTLIDLANDYGAQLEAVEEAIRCEFDRCLAA